jgi:hypothetical protein
VELLPKKKTQLIRAKNHNKVTGLKNSGHQVNSIERPLITVTELDNNLLIIKNKNFLFYLFFIIMNLFRPIRL